MKAANVALATTRTADVRIPAMIMAVAMGSSTRVSTWKSFIPIPRAASVVAGSTWLMPTFVLIKTGSAPIKTKARMVGGVPMPRNGRAKANTARLGNVLPRLPKVRIILSSHLIRVVMMPTINPEITEIPREMKVMERCCPRAVVNCNDLSIM